MVTSSKTAVLDYKWIKAPVAHLMQSIIDWSCDDCMTL